MKQIFVWSVNQKKNIIFVFKLFYFSITALIIIGFFMTLYNSQPLLLYEIGLLSGKAASIIFIITISPGIMQRFNLNWQIRSLLVLFRRYLGISVYVLGFLHFSYIRLLPIIVGQINLNVIFTSFELFGLVSIFLLSFLFFTSNDFSMKKLGPWWKRIHRIIYVVAWLLFLHTALQRISVYSISLGIAAVFELLSLVNYYGLRKKISTAQSS